MSDPRPFSDADYRNECIMKLIAHLSSNGYPSPLSKKILTAPSNKEFISIFQFLYHQIDPSYGFDDKGIEDEIPVLLKQLRYVGRYRVGRLGDSW